MKKTPGRALSQGKETRNRCHMHGTDHQNARIYRLQLQNFLEHADYELNVDAGG